MGITRTNTQSIPLIEKTDPDVRLMVIIYVIRRILGDVIRVR